MRTKKFKILCKNCLENKKPCQISSKDLQKLGFRSVKKKDDRISCYQAKIKVDDHHKTSKKLIQSKKIVQIIIKTDSIEAIKKVFRLQYN